MKGVVFVEFLEMVENRFSFEMSDRIIESSNLPSKGVYTSVGTYDYHEILTLVENLSQQTNIPAEDLLKEFGQYLFKRFYEMFPVFFEGVKSSFDFLSRVENYVHLEVKKLYADAELPTFECSFPEPEQLNMKYQSKRNLRYLAEGLIKACIEHYRESCNIEVKTVSGDPLTTLFLITKTA
ncbi:MAG: heme NO-binding domain-containing protein [Thermodesulfobacteriota bacterium]